MCCGEVCRKVSGHMAEMPIKYEAKPSAFLALSQCSECFILCKQELVHALTVLKNLHMNA